MTRKPVRRKLREEWGPADEWAIAQFAGDAVFLVILAVLVISWWLQ